MARSAWPRTSNLAHSSGTLTTDAFKTKRRIQSQRILKSYLGRFLIQHVTHMPVSTPLSFSLTFVSLPTFWFLGLRHVGSRTMDATATAPSFDQTNVESSDRFHPSRQRYVDPVICLLIFLQSPSLCTSHLSTLSHPSAPKPLSAPPLSVAVSRNFRQHRQ